MKMNKKEQLAKLREEIKEAEKLLQLKKLQEQRIEESIKKKTFACWFSNDVHHLLVEEYGNPTENDDVIGFVGLYEDHLEAAKELVSIYSNYLDSQFIIGFEEKYIVQTKCLSDQTSAKFKVKYGKLNDRFEIVEEKAKTPAKKAAVKKKNST